MGPLALTPPGAAAILRAVDSIVERSVRNTLANVEGIDEPWAEKWLVWAENWLTNEDRTWAAAADAARAARAEWAAWTAAAEAADAAAARAAAAAAEAAHSAARAAAWAAARAADAAVDAAVDAAAEDKELRLQAEDIHREIPEWPGDR